MLPGSIPPPGPNLKILEAAFPPLKKKKLKSSIPPLQNAGLTLSVHSKNSKKHFEGGGNAAFQFFFVRGGMLPPKSSIFAQGGECCLTAFPPLRKG